MNRLWLLRFIKLFVVFGIPLLSVIYAYQFTSQDRANEEVVPFRSFLLPNVSYVSGGADLKNIHDSDLKPLELLSPITVVNFWATWCPPCVEEFPAMLELERQLTGKGVEFVFVSIDEKWSDVEQFVASYLRGHSPKRMLWDPERKGAIAFGSNKFPETYVIRRDGWVVEKIIGLQMWTRPVVVQYFLDLGEKFKNLDSTSVSQVRWPEALSLFSTAYAQASSDEGLGVTPIVHEQDKKAIEKLRKNIETATQNLQNAEAAQKVEVRNLSEQRVVAERRLKEQRDAESDLSKIEAKAKEVDQIISRTKTSLVTEQNEKKKIEGELKDIRNRINDLEKRLERAKDDLTQANKSLNTRIQSVETLEKAENSSKEELSALKSQVNKAKDLASERKSATEKAESEVKKRERRLTEIQSDVTKSRRLLDEQKNKLTEFETILKK